MQTASVKTLRREQAHFSHSKAGENGHLGGFKIKLNTKREQMASLSPQTTAVVFARYSAGPVGLCLLCASPGSCRSWSTHPACPFLSNSQTPMHPSKPTADSPLICSLIQTHSSPCGDCAPILPFDPGLISQD